jgi:hypothetical protein
MPILHASPGFSVPDLSQLAGVPVTRLGVVRFDRYALRYAGRPGLRDPYLKRERLQRPAQD